MCVQLYVLADSTFNSSAVDEVAAEHVAADCVIHYGPVSCAAQRRVPAYFVYPQQAADAAVARAAVQRQAAALAPEQVLVVLFDSACSHLSAALADLQVWPCKLRTTYLETMQALH